MFVISGHADNETETEDEEKDPWMPMVEEAMQKHKTAFEEMKMNLIYSAGPFLTYKLGGQMPPQSPLVPPHEITFCPPQEKSLLLNLYKQIGKNNK